MQVRNKRGRARLGTSKDEQKNNKIGTMYNRNNELARNKGKKKIVKELETKIKNLEY